MRAIDLLRRAVIATVLGCSASAPSEPDVDAPEAGLQSGAASDEDASPGTDDQADDWPAGSYDLVSIDRCRRDAIPEGFAFAPAAIFEWTPMRDRLVCSRSRSIECSHASDCTAQPFGRCQGNTSAQCTYPHTPSTCTADGDCSALPDGVCIPMLSTDVVCDEQGNNCAPQGPYCHYLPLNQVCDSDEECTAVPGGTCRREVWQTRCIYLGCEDDGDCSPDERCDCGSCVSAACRSDAECGSDELCRRENACGWGPSGGFHCTTAAGDCRTDDDCPESTYCDYDAGAGRFVCEPYSCETP